LTDEAWAALWSKRVEATKKRVDRLLEKSIESDRDLARDCAA
jgi:hypothetical protein